MIRAILAHDAMWGIGKGGDLPWPKNSEDLAWFKESTAGGVVVMGRKTWESLPRKPLPNRTNVIVSNTIKQNNEIEVIKSDIYRSRLVTINYTENVWIIGGARLLEDSLNIIDELWLNNVGGNYDCDVFLPKREITRQFEPGTTDVKSFGIITVWKRRDNATVS